MTISGLLPTLKPAVVISHISNFAGKKAAIDGKGWLYRGAYSCAYELATKQPTHNYLSFVYKMLNLLKRCSITPIFCIDGRELPAKMRTNDLRIADKKKEKEKGMELMQSGNTTEAKKAFTKCLKITKKMIYKLIDMLNSLGVEVIIAPYEADAQLAYLCRTKYADFAISEDSDLLCHSCPLTVFKLGSSGECEYIDLPALRKQRQEKKSLGDTNLDILMKLSEKDFVYVCILAGCDYLPSVKGMGLKKALKYFDRFKTVESVIRRMKVEGPFMTKVPDGYEAVVKMVSESFLYQSVYDPNTKEMVSLNEYNESKRLNLDFVGKALPDVEQFAKGLLDLYTLEPREIEVIDVKALFGDQARSFQNNNNNYVNTQEPYMNPSYLKSVALAEIRKQKAQSQPNPSPQKKPTQSNPAQYQDFYVQDDWLATQFDKLENQIWDDDIVIPDETFEEEKKEDEAFIPENFNALHPEIEEKLDFLFEICKEYSRGYEDEKEESQKEPIKKNNNKPSFVSQHLSVIPESQEVPKKPSPFKRVLGNIDSKATQLIDSFSKIKLMNKTPENKNGDQNLKQKEKESQMIEEIDGKKSNPKKRKLSQLDLNKDRKSDSQPPSSTTQDKKKTTSEQDHFKKVKKNSDGIQSQSQSQPKLSLFFKK